jgi:hypothetical protein
MEAVVGYWWLGVFLVLLLLGDINSLKKIMWVQY